MGVILSDLIRGDLSQVCNWWRWRPTLTIIHLSGVIDDDRLERMSLNGAGAEVSQIEARRIADLIEREVLPKLSSGGQVKLGGNISHEPQYTGSITDATTEQVYGADREWLMTFVKFCRECQGFRVF